MGMVVPERLRTSIKLGLSTKIHIASPKTTIERTYKDKNARKITKYNKQCRSHLWSTQPTPQSGQCVKFVLFAGLWKVDGRTTCTDISTMNWSRALEVFKPYSVSVDCSKCSNWNNLGLVLFHLPSHEIMSHREKYLRKDKLG